ncbi:MAG: hypothetical protein IT353_09100 [Gemmatimonadaceae bacterium]|nr:hypothetical protein [Gemmatimonadaceae bacterium]
MINTLTSSRSGQRARAIGCALITAALLLPATAAAQNETLLKGGRHDYGGFGGPIFRITSVAGETMALGGGGGAFLVDRRFAIGGAGYGGTQRVNARILGTETRGEMDFGYGGVTLEVITRPSKLVHATFGVLLGGGSLSVWPDDLRPRRDREPDETFSVVEPQLMAELNMTRWFRVGASVAYRAAFNAEVSSLVNDKLSGISGGLVLRFGSF